MTGETPAIAPASLVEPVIIRPARPDEIVSIRAQWLDTYSKSAFGRAFLDSTAKHGLRVFLKAWGPVVDLLIDRSEVLCLCPEDSPEATVYGWMVHERAYKAPGRENTHVLHYLHVRASSRRLGYGGKLLARLPSAWSASHMTPSLGSMLDHWRQDASLETSKCPDCGDPLRQITRANETTYVCVRKPHPRRPVCDVKFSRPVGFAPPHHPAVTVDLTLV